MWRFSGQKGITLHQTRLEGALQSISATLEKRVWGQGYLDGMDRECVFQ